MKRFVLILCLLVLASLTLSWSLVSTGIASGSKLVLLWEDNSDNEEGFIVERKTAVPGETYEEIDRVGANVTTYSDTRLNASTQYCYQVCAFNSAGPSTYSNEACATTSPD